MSQENSAGTAANRAQADQAIVTGRWSVVVAGVITQIALDRVSLIPKHLMPGQH
jgi:hypothetical protein